MSKIKFRIWDNHNKVWALECGDIEQAAAVIEAYGEELTVQRFCDEAKDEKGVLFCEGDYVKKGGVVEAVEFDDYEFRIVGSPVPICDISGGGAVIVGNNCENGKRGEA